MKVSDIGYYYILIKDNKSENWIKLNSKFIESYDIINLKILHLEDKMTIINMKIP